MAILDRAPATTASVRARMARRRNELYLRSEKFLSVISSRGSRRILFSEKPDWADTIRNGFRRMPHEVEFGPITEESYKRYDIVVPLTLDALEDARRHAPPCEISLPIPTLESVRLCDDKYEFNRKLIKAGFGQYIPKLAEGQRLNPPYILKKRIGWWGQNCYIVQNHDDENALLDRVNDPGYFCQELIPGSTEFATHIFFVGGRIVKALNIKYKFAGESPIKGQDEELLKVVHRCPYLDLFARILRTIRFEGLCCVNYKVAKRQPYLLEINPRFGGSLSPYFFSFIRYMR